MKSLAAAIAFLLPLPALAQSERVIDERAERARSGDERGRTAERVIDVFRPEKVVHPIGIPEFAVERVDAKLSASLPDAIGKDLEFTGLFRVLDRGSYLETKGSVKPDGTGTKWEDWTVLKASLVARGAVRSEAGKLSAKVWVFDVAHGSKIGEKVVSDSDPVMLGHRAADAIYELATGEKSIFSTSLAYVNNRTGSKEIWISSFDGKKEVQVTRNRSINIAPSWSPDSVRLIFTSYVRNHPDLYFYDRRQDKFFRVSDRAGVNVGGAWAPRGAVIAATLSDKGNADIYLMGEDGKGAKRLTEHYGLDVSPTWSPDGRKIAFVSDRGGAPNVYVMNVDGSEPKRLTFDSNGAGKDNQSPSWSPRGERIAFQSRIGGAWQICTMAIDGRQVRQLTADGNNEDPAWSPDGRMLAYVKNGKLWVMEADGSNARAIGTAGGSYSNVVWSARTW